MPSKWRFYTLTAALVRCHGTNNHAITCFCGRLGSCCNWRLNSTIFLCRCGQKYRNKAESFHPHVTKSPLTYHPFISLFLCDGETLVQRRYFCRLELKQLLIVAECFHHVPPIRFLLSSTQRDCLQIKMHFRQLFRDRSAEW